MRFAGAITALLLLSACDSSSGPTGLVPAGTAAATKPADASLATPDSAFDYRYTFRLPASRIEAVQESHARGCDQLGPARCRITAMRYKVGADANGAEGGIAAVLTLKLDPAIARAFGKAASQTVTSAHGVLIDADIAGAETADAAGRSERIVAKLRDALADAEAQARGVQTPDQKAQSAAKIDRLRGAIATIGEIDQGAGASAATAPVIFTYNAGGAVPGFGASPQATFDTAGDTFLSSLAGLLVTLAGVGPWMVLLLGGALFLRWFLARTEDPAAPVLPPAPREDSEANRNVIQRWFARDEAKEHEPV